MGLHAIGVSMFWAESVQTQSVGTMAYGPLNMLHNNCFSVSGLRQPYGLMAYLSWNLDVRAY